MSLSVGWLGELVSETHRLFIAIELPRIPALPDVIEMVRKAAPANTVKWLEIDKMHLTLKFLGDVPTHQIKSIENGLQAAIHGHRPFSIELTGLGCFPNFSRPTVIWLGLKNPTGELKRLRDAVERHIAPLGYPTEDREFSPHLTLGRVKRDLAKPVVGKIGQAMQALTISKLGEWPCEAIRLMRSELRPTGPNYTCVAEVRLLDD
jgi:2'-5' RNA ligase